MLRHKLKPLSMLEVLMIIFLPGAGGSPAFWQPVASLLPLEWKRKFIGWPGLGDQPHRPAINGFDDLVSLVEAEIDGPVDLVAQSLGGVVASRIAIARPEAVRRLVLVVTSGGVNMSQFGASDWRSDYRKQFPHAASWILNRASAGALEVARIQAPTLLIWGDSDPISPVAVGLHLEKTIPAARLHVVAGGDHSIALNQSQLVAGLIRDHLA